MTGDGAVVRPDHEAARLWAKTIVEGRGAETGPWANLARAYLEREAEIERLTEAFDIVKRQMVLALKGKVDNAEKAARLLDAVNAQNRRAEASEARAADLLKALEESNRDMHVASNCLRDIGYENMANRLSVRRQLNVGITTRDVIAAAKGGTV